MPSSKVVLAGRGTIASSRSPRRRHDPSSSVVKESVASTMAENGAPTTANKIRPTEEDAGSNRPGSEEGAALAGERTVQPAATSLAAAAAVVWQYRNSTGTGWSNMPQGVMNFGYALKWGKRKENTYDYSVDLNAMTQKNNTIGTNDGYHYVQFEYKQPEHLTSRGVTWINEGETHILTDENDCGWSWTAHDATHT